MNTTSEILSTIERKQNQLILHSVLYYHYDQPLWTDALYDRVVKDLLELKINESEIFKQSLQYGLFKEWDGSTGIDLLTHESIRWATKVMKKIIIPYMKKHNMSNIPDLKQLKFKKVIHETPMPSLMKVHNEQELRTWHESICKELGLKP